MKKNQRNKDGQRHGQWESYHLNGKLSYKANYKNGKPHGYWEYDYLNAKILIQFFI
jgi:antitoxin component YwqK of YwqJK toxin-antitoxin module